LVGLADLAGPGDPGLDRDFGPGFLGDPDFFRLAGSSPPDRAGSDDPARARDRRSEDGRLFWAAALRPDLRSRVVAMSSSSSTSSSSTLAAVHEPPSSLVRAALR